MREIGSVADDLDVGAILEGRFSHIAALWDAHFGEAVAVQESKSPNLCHRWWDGDIREAEATIVFVYCFISAFYAIKGRKVKS